MPFSINTMTKEGYTHIIVPKELHSILKREAEERDMSISKYIENVLSQIQAIEELVSINTSKNPSEDLKTEDSSSPGRIRTSVTGSKGQYA